MAHAWPPNLIIIQTINIIFNKIYFKKYAYMLSNLKSYGQTELKFYLANSQSFKPNLRLSYQA